MVVICMVTTSVVTTWQQLGIQLGILNQWVQPCPTPNILRRGVFGWICSKRRWSSRLYSPDRVNTMETRICKNCGNEFLPSRRKRKFCSKECYNKYYGIPLEPKPLKPKKCKNCGIEFIPTTQNQKYCTKKCGVEAVRKRQCSKNGFDKGRVYIYDMEKDCWFYEDRGEENG